MPSNALDYITIKGFKSIASIEKLELKPINVLIGANGSGKSNFLGVFEFLQAIGEGSLRRYVTAAGGAEKVLHFGSETTAEITIGISFSEYVSQYEVELSPTADDGLFPSDENAEPLPLGLLPGERQLGAGLSGQYLDGPVQWVHDQVAGWRLYHIYDTSRMRKTASVDDNHFLRPDGSNLAAFLYYLRERHRDSYNLIRRTVQGVAPFFEDFVLEPLRLKSDDIKLEWKHKNSDQYFDASSLSDGTLRFIALAVLFLQPESHRPSTILVDEPELGLHPSAIEMLASMIRHASVDTQVIVSTQSPILLDHFQPEDVLVADRVAGGTRLTRLDPAQLATWLEDYSLGQLWEKNELGGRPVRD